MTPDKINALAAQMFPFGFGLSCTKELKGFEKNSLNPDETKTVSFRLNKRAFAYYRGSMRDWHAESGSHARLYAPAEPHQLRRRNTGG